MKLKDKMAVITGAGSGIGAVIAQTYLKEGARCILVDQKKLEDRSASFDNKYRNQFIPVIADISSQEGIQHIVTDSIHHYGQIDILFNGAGFFDMCPFLEESWDSFHQLFDINVKGTFFLMQAVAKQMVKQGKGGKIINVSSIAGRRGEALAAHYSATKAAIISYTQSAASALAPYNIRVNALAPGAIDTSMWEKVDSLYAKYDNIAVGEKTEQFKKAIALGRLGKPEDLAGISLFLASSDSDYITGQTINIDGGSYTN